MLRTQSHVVLLGDSVFDSHAYLRGAPDMAARLGRTADDLRASLRAVSGSRLADIPRQLARLPENASHMIVSIGGNDLLDLGAQLRHAPGGWLEKMRSAAPLMDEFRKRYMGACEALAQRPLPTAVCTIYDPPVTDPMLRMVASTISAAVNDVVSEQARRRGFDVIDLRPVCRAPEDFYDPIHPSPTGADKIARVLAEWVKRVDARAERSRSTNDQSLRPTNSPNLRASEAAAKR